MPAEPPPPDLDDLKAGSEAAWRDAVRLLGPPLQAYLRLRGVEDPEEILGEVFLDLARGVDRLDGDWTSFRMLAFVVARRRAVDSFRQHQRRPARPTEPGNLILDGPRGDVELEALDQLDHDWVVDLLRLLTPLQREIITMRFMLGLSVREVAAATGSTETGVKANQRRALAALRRHLSAADGRPGAAGSAREVTP